MPEQSPASARARSKRGYYEEVTRAEAEAEARRRNLGIGEEMQRHHRLGDPDVVVPYFEAVCVSGEEWGLAERHSEGRRSKLRTLWDELGNYLGWYPR